MAKSDFPSGAPPLRPPPPPPTPNPTGRRRHRRDGKSKLLLADDRFRTSHGPPKPTTTCTTTHALNAALLTCSPSPSPKATTTTASSTTTSCLPAGAPLVHPSSKQAATTRFQNRQDDMENKVDRTGFLKARALKSLPLVEYMDDDEVVANPRSTNMKPTLNVFAVKIKKTAHTDKASNSKPAAVANKQKPKDPSYRPFKGTGEWSSESTDDDFDVGFVPGDLPVFRQVKGQQEHKQFISPVSGITGGTSSVSPPRPLTRQPTRPPPPPPPPPIPNRLKRKRIDDPTYRPSKNSEGYIPDDNDAEEDDESDEGIEALIRVVKDNNAKVKKVRRKGAERQQENINVEEDENGSHLVLKEIDDDDEKRHSSMKKKTKNRKSVLDPSYKPPKDEEDDSEEYSDEYTSTDGWNRQRRSRVRAPEGGDDSEENHNDYNGNVSVNVNDKTKNDVVPTTKQILPCQARPCLPPKFGRRKVNRLSNPPRIYDPSYKPGTTSSDDDSSNGIDSSWSSGEGNDRKKKRKRLYQPKNAPKKKNQTVSYLHQEVIRLMLEETKPKPAFAMPVTKKRKGPRLIRRITSDRSFCPSDTPTDQYSDEWYSSEYSSELDVKNKKRKKGTKKKKDQWNVTRVAPGLGLVTGRVLDLGCGRPIEASEEETRESVKPEEDESTSRRKLERERNGTIDAIDGTYEPSADSPSSEFESGAMPELDRSISSIEISNDNEKPELIFEPEKEVILSPVNVKGKIPQIHTGYEPLSNVRTAFYSLCHGRYSPWPPARGTVYCKPCFREQVIVRGLLIRRGISETLRLLKVLLGGGSDFGNELDEALEEILDGVVATGQTSMTRVKDHDQGQDNEDEREERVQRGQNTRTKPVPSAQSSLAELPEDVRTLLVLRRLSDVVNTRRMPTISTARPSGPDGSLETPASLHVPSDANAVSPDHCYQQQDPTGPSRYSSPSPPCPPLTLRGGTPKCAATSTGINASYFFLKPPSTKAIISLPGENPLDNAMNILHDALGISTWQARRLWDQYEGSGIWDLAQVDVLAKKSYAKFLNGHKATKELPWAEGKESSLEGGMGKAENLQAAMLGLEGLARLEEEIMTALAEKGGREEEKQGRTRQSDGGRIGITTGATRSIIVGAVTGRKQSHDDCRLGWGHAPNPNQKCKLTKPIELFNPKNQEAQPVSPQRPREQPKVIPCHSCSRSSTVNHNSGATVRRNDYTEMGGRPWVKALQWTFDINESEAAKMTLNSLLDLISRSGKAAHVKSSGWEFVVYRPVDHDDADIRIVFLDVEPGLDLHL
ncbi:hypothetical protein B0T13DRAFT_405655 [Neurospora crassa]|nr:hypothetical protein B0T13DRAFT_405655 [Neurospora crassa]